MTTQFVQFWKLINDILRSRGLPDMLYGEARDWWNHHDKQRAA
jgi:hypothetical protein